VSFVSTARFDDEHRLSAQGELNAAGRVRAAFRSIEIFETNDDALDAARDATQQASKSRRDELLKAGADRLARVHGEPGSELEPIPRFTLPDNV
jgi:hypothetical protein